MRILTIIFLNIFLLAQVCGQGKIALEIIDNGIAKSTVNIQKTIKKATISPRNLSDTQWSISLQQFGMKDHVSSRPLFDSLKTVQAGKKKRAKVKTSNKRIEKKTIDQPVVFNSYEANRFDSGTPSDNGLAVSDDGYVVSVINSTLFFANAEGKKIFERSFEDFFEGLDVPGFIFDPKVLYDPIEDRFVMVVLSGSTPGNSFVIVMASHTSNPLLDWDMYALLGDPLGVDAWFDYPSIGITADDLFISGNLFGQGFADNLVYQIDKESMYQGDSLVWVAHGDIREVGLSSGKAFTLVPVSQGTGEEYGPGGYLVSNRWHGGDYVNLFKTSGTTTENPTILLDKFDTEPYSLSANAFQPETDNVLQTNDCRVLSAYIENDNIHYVHHTADSSAFCQLFYGIIDLEERSVESSSLGGDTIDYAFPAIAHYRNNEGMNESMLVFLAAGESLFPELRAVAVSNELEWSESATIKRGETFISVLRDSIERWGDYSGISKRHNSDPPEVYMSGMLGGSANGPLSNWVGSVSSEGFPPIAAFRATRTEGKPTLITTMRSEVTGFPDSIRWEFPGGTPSTSTKQNQTVFYKEEGIFDVTLTAYNPFGISQEIKEDYVTVKLPTAVLDEQEVISDLQFYPNPIRNFTPAKIKIELQQNERLLFQLVDTNGKLIRVLKNDRVKAGSSIFQFNTEMLINGVYYLVVRDSTNKIIANEKIIVSN